MQKLDLNSQYWIAWKVEEQEEGSSRYQMHIVKLGIKEWLNKEQTGFKGLFTYYQPFHEKKFEPKITKSCTDCKKRNPFY